MEFSAEEFIKKPDIHDYNDFDFALLYQDYKQNVADLRLFGSQILKLLDLS